MAQRKVDGKWLSSEPRIGPGVSIAGLVTVAAALPLLLLVGALGSAPTSVDTLSSVDVVAATAAAADRDHDGVPDQKDAFPTNPKEWADLDGDHVGNNSDPDRDGDGYKNNLDVFPDGAMRKPDFDNDGTPDATDTDIDGDGKSNAAEGGARALAAYDANNDGKHDRYQRALDPKFDTDGDGRPDVTEMRERARELAQKYGVSVPASAEDFSDFPAAFWARAKDDVGRLAACVVATHDRDNDGLWDRVVDKNVFVPFGGSAGDYFAKYEGHYNSDVAAKAKDFGFALGAPGERPVGIGTTLVGNVTDYRLPPTYVAGSGLGIYTTTNAIPEFNTESARYAYYESIYAQGKPPEKFSGHYEVIRPDGTPVVYTPTQFENTYGATGYTQTYTGYGSATYTPEGGYATTSGGVSGHVESPSGSGSTQSQGPPGYQPPPGSSSGAPPPPPPPPEPPPPSPPSH